MATPGFLAMPTEPAAEVASTSGLSEPQAEAMPAPVPAMVPVAMPVAVPVAVPLAVPLAVPVASARPAAALPAATPTAAPSDMFFTANEATVLGSSTKSTAAGGLGSAARAAATPVSRARPFIPALALGSVLGMAAVSQEAPEVAPEEAAAREQQLPEDAGAASQAASPAAHQSLARSLSSSPAKGTRSPGALWAAYISPSKQVLSPLGAQMASPQGSPSRRAAGASTRAPSFKGMARAGRLRAPAVLRFAVLPEQGNVHLIHLSRPAPQGPCSSTPRSTPTAPLPQAWPTRAGSPASTGAPRPSSKWCALQPGQRWAPARA